MASVVIGAGLAGLNAALTLQEAGEDVELYESSDAVGGRVRSDYIDGFILDRGFQLINSGYSEIKRLGLIKDLDFRKADRTIDVLTSFGISSIGDPRLHPVASLRSPLGSLKEKVALLAFMGDKPNSDISLRDALLASGCGDFYENVLRPFLRGVFLSELDRVDSSYGREIVKSFIVGDSGLPSAGVGTLSEALAARVENIHLNSGADSLDQFAGKKIILATDSLTASRLLGVAETAPKVDSYTWYHSVDAGLIQSKRLRVASVQTPIVNSVAISNVVPEYAPQESTLISTTTLLPQNDNVIAEELAKFWNISPTQFTTIKRYEISNSLPLFMPGNRSVAQSAKVSENIYRAGDYLSAGSQNGALISGRLAANELLLDQSR